MANDYHEPFELLDDRTRDHHRALTSLKEEIEAVDWYHQRVALSSDPTLAGVLAHNRDEEIEHACMTLEWLRRSMPAWDTQLRKYLFSSEAVISEVKEHDEQSAEDSEHSRRKARSERTERTERTEQRDRREGTTAPSVHRSLGIGSLKGVR